MGLVTLLTVCFSVALLRIKNKNLRSCPNEMEWPARMHCYHLPHRCQTHSDTHVQVDMPISF